MASLAHIAVAGGRRDWEWRAMSGHPESAFRAWSPVAAQLPAHAERPRWRAEKLRQAEYNTGTPSVGALARRPSQVSSEAWRWAASAT